MADIKGKPSKPPTAAAVTTTPDTGTATPDSAGKYWVTWKDEANGTAARKSALIWGPMPQPPPHLAGFFVAGPFSTKADAQAYVKAIGTGAIKPPPGTPIVGGGVNIPNPLSGIGAVGHWIGLIAEHLSDGAMWRSLGWLALGALLVIAGVYLWFRTSATYKGIEESITGIAGKL